MTGITVGSIITLGRYEQSDTSARTPIEWIVLDIDGQNATLISKYSPEVMAYNDERVNITWGNCSLRAWLNGAFLESAFTLEEQARILTTRVTTPIMDPVTGEEHPGETLDKVYLLSDDEAERYFASDEERKCLPTGKAFSDNKRYWGRVFDMPAECHWWLRSPGDSADCAAAVIDNGDILYEGWHVDSDDVAVRPVITLRLS